MQDSHAFGARKILGPSEQRSPDRSHDGEWAIHAFIPGNRDIVVPVL